MKLLSKEFYEVQDNFERMIYASDVYFSSVKKEDKEYWHLGRIYTDGNLNVMFKGYLAGYAYAKSLARTSSLPLTS